MTIKLFFFENDIEISDEYISVLELLEKQQYSKYIDYFCELVEGCSDNNEILVFNGESKTTLKNSIIIHSPYDIEADNKTILSKLHKHVSNLLTQNFDIKFDIEQKYQQILSSIEELISTLDTELYINDELDTSALLKFIGLRPYIINSNNKINKILSFISLCSELNLYDLIIFNSMKMYFTDNEINEIYKYAIYKNVPLLLIEPIHDETINQYEKKIIITKEFDEIKIL